jgi:hypothetical protein
MKQVMGSKPARRKYCVWLVEVIEPRFTDGVHAPRRGGRWQAPNRIPAPRRDLVEAGTRA